MVRRVERAFALLEDLGSVPATSQGGLKNGTRSAVGHFHTWNQNHSEIPGHAIYGQHMVKMRGLVTTDRWISNP